MLRYSFLSSSKFRRLYGKLGKNEGIRVLLITRRYLFFYRLSECRREKESIL